MRNKKLYYVLVAILAVAAVFGFYYLYRTAQRLQSQPPKPSSYLNEDFKISLEYPSYWLPDFSRGSYKNNPLYFKGIDGFFGIDAIGAAGILSVEDGARWLASSSLKPYGSKPEISTTTVDGEEAALVLPSDDQPPEKNGEAALVIKYPAPISIASNTFSFFMLYGDKNNIDDIASKLKFIGFGQ